MKKFFFSFYDEISNLEIFALKAKYSCFMNNFLAACSDAVPDSRRVRTMSSSTLISEVVSLVRLPIRGTTKHTRLEETPADVEDGYESTETQAE